MEEDSLECQAELIKLIQEGYIFLFRWVNELKTIMFSIDYRLAP